jgi:hypothetical protein
MQVPKGGEMKRFTITMAFLGVAAFAPMRLVGAQATQPPATQPPATHGDKKPPTIPADSRPPAGMCRIWLDDVPAGQQPAPTDCATAVKNKPQNGRVIFGDDYAKRDEGDKKKNPPPFVKSFTQPPPPPARRP